MHDFKRFRIMIYGQQYQQLLNHDSHSINLIMNTPDKHIFKIEISNRANLKIIDIKFNSSNGGSFRIYFSKKNSNKFSECTDLINKILKEGLNNLKQESGNRIGHILGEGLILAILFQDPVSGEPDSLTASLIAEKCYEKGLLVVHTGRESIKIGPPLTISDEALLEGLSVISESFMEISQHI